jgi:RNA polymerase sigma-70 factor, ECF subfamily
MSDTVNINYETFEENYRCFSDEIHKYAMKLTGDVHVAEDIVQQTFLDYATYKGTIRQIRPYLYKVAARRATDWKRNCVRSHAKQGLDPIDCKTQPADKAICACEEEDCLRKAIRQLSPPVRAALKAVYFDGLTYEEAAEQLGIPVNRLGVYVNRAITNLRKKMTDPSINNPSAKNSM